MPSPPPPEGWTYERDHENPLETPEFHPSSTNVSENEGSERPHSSLLRLQKLVPWS